MDVSSPSSSRSSPVHGLHSPSASPPDYVQGRPAIQAFGIPIQQSVTSASAREGNREPDASGQAFQGSLDRAPTDPGPSAPPGLHIDFPPSHEAPVVDRHYASVVAMRTYGGYATPVPRTILEDPGVRSRLLAYAHWFIEHPEHEFLHHLGAIEGLAIHHHSFSYMYRPLTPKEFGYIVPTANVDWAQVIPVMVLRMRLPQRFPWQYGKLEIAGIEMIQPTQHLQSRLELKEIFGYTRSQSTEQKASSRHNLRRAWTRPFSDPCVLSPRMFQEKG
ncbi:polyketide synthase [Pseudozyma hubeiensis SY62]|uniref:Polyketide synthase n=1 Tax=Pseudozyma hubeiensis (strain SY62) TaxID=1305764 RepID=R9P977_PSEHS|nr:polyketide synthase [Pseudozyma hubeiensis SY62]GAC97938.1 polyketide synthase [Pseudozyma hubeiensis SY62]